MPAPRGENRRRERPRVRRHARSLLGAGGQRLGSHLLDCLVGEARAHGIGAIHGLILADNAAMIDLARRRGFSIADDPDEAGCVRAVLAITAG